MVLGFLIATLVIFSLNVLINLISLSISDKSSIVVPIATFIYLILITFNIFCITQVV